MPMTTFDPQRDGFHFANTFTNYVADGLVTTGGRCGGMTYTMLDCYFERPGHIPRTTDLPPDGSPLSTYIMNRQMDSLRDQLPMFGLYLSPGRTDEGRFESGLRLDRELGQLKRFIDAGQPVPIGLIHPSSDPG